MSLTIGLDLDGVTVDFQGGWARAYEQWFGKKIPAAKLASWNSFLDATHFETAPEFWRWIDAIPNFWVDLDPIPGALGGVFRLEREFGHRISVITSRHEKVRDQTSAWIRRYWPVTKTLPTAHHTGKSTKGMIDVQVYIDDAPAVVEALSGKPCVVLFDRPWNAEVKLTRNLHRVKGWDELVRFIRLLEHPEVPE